MQQGIYKPIPKRWREAYNVGAFTNNLQIWLSIFAFNTFATSSLFSLLHWINTVMPQPSFIKWLAIFAVACFLLFSVFAAVWSFVSLIIFFKKGICGQKIEYDPETINPIVLKAIVPMKSKNNIKG